MRILVVTFLLVHTSMLCFGQTHEDGKNKIIQLPVVYNNFERLDLNALRAKSTKSHGVKVLANKDTVAIETYDYQFSSKDGDQVRFSGDNYGGYRIDQQIVNSYFNVVKTYYLNGNIKSKGLKFNVFYGTFKKGKWYSFRPDGKLASSIDYDKPFRFSFEQLIAYLAQQKIPVKLGPIPQNPGYLTSIEQSLSEDQSPVWVISWLKEPDTIEDLVINGTNGILMSKRTRRYINN